MIALSTALLFALAGLLLAVVVLDLRRNVIPNRIIYPAIILGLVLALLQGSFLISVATGAGPFMAFLALAMIIPTGVGGGDVKLAGLVGLLAGWPGVLWAIVLAFLLCAPVALVLAISKQRRTLPFGPFLVAGVGITSAIHFWEIRGP